MKNKSNNTILSNPTSCVMIKEISAVIFALLTISFVIIGLALTGNAESITIKNESEITGKGAYILGDYEIGIVYRSGVQNSTDNDLFAYIKKYLGNDKIVIIPEMFGGYNVELISEEAFLDNTSLEKVLIADNVKTIDEYAFKGCSNLKEIVFSENSNIKAFYDSAFNGCSNLEEIYINIKSDKKDFYINNAFAGSGIKKVTVIAPNIYSLDINHNSNCSVEEFYFDVPLLYSAYSNSIPKTVKKLTVTGEINFKSNALSQCSNLTELYVGSIYNIPPKLFSGCTSLKSVKTGEINSIGDSFFVHSGSIFENSAIEYFECTTIKYSIDEQTFKNAKHLKSFVITGECENYSMIDGSLYDKGGTKLIFYNNSEMKESVSVPENTEIISDYAFSSCSQAKEFTISPNVKYVSDYAMWGLDSVETLIFNAENCTYFGEEYDGRIQIGESSYMNVEKAGITRLLNLKEIIIGSSVKTIPPYLFYERTDITSYTIPEGVRYISAKAFEGCKNIEELNLPESLEFIDASELVNTPWYISNTQSDVLNKIWIEGSCLMQFTNPPSYLFIPEGITGISNGVFKSTEIITCTLPSTMKYIGKSAFMQCKNLSIINFPEGLIEIGGSAISYTGVKSITLPSTLKKLGGYAFMSCGSLTKVNYNCISLEDCISQSPFYCTYITDFTISEGVTRIPSYLFKSGKKNDLNVNIPSTVNEIAPYAFYESNKNIILESKAINLTVGDYAFYKCNISKISGNFFEAMTEIGEYAFSGSTLGNGKVNLNSIIHIGGYAFTESKISSLHIAGNLEYWGYKSFENCDYLSVVIVDNGISVEYVPSSGFYGCNTLDEVTLPNEIKEISSYSFAYCTDLETVNWTAEGKKIGFFSFGYCENLKYFDLSNIKYISSNAFIFCPSRLDNYFLTFLYYEGSIEDKETTISSGNFNGASSLETAVIGNEVEEIGSQAFADCENLESAVISESVTEIADDAFEGCDKLTIYCAAGSYVETYALNNNIKVSTLVIAPIANQTYTGKEIKPSVSVSYSDESLDKTDYTVSYSNNINIGTAKVTVTGTGYFKYLTSKAGFEIVARKISDAVISGISDCEYTGKAITPEINVVYDGITLKKGVDYTVSYSDNTQVGTATVTVKGIGNFKGETKASFEIVEKGGQSSDNPPDTNTPDDNDTTVFDRIIEFLTNSVSTIINILIFIWNLFGI